ncbi:hypothetical protein LPY66_15195 [Dehalobacter sp. DCM]|uniref:hypothetical protein n=1 Tax=Dehalobacter sp. DCM TaxID=2907827 RepID=UPI00308162B7|nr:hypothetical protein LPY66_15195 [Dehalobacter sp. DCM]
MKAIRILFALLIVICLSGCTTSETNSDRAATGNISSDNLSVSDIKQKVEQPIVLYNGISLNETDRDAKVIDGSDVIKNKEMYLKYEREYYLYSDGTYIGRANGKIEGRGLDYYWQVVFPSEIGKKYEVAISNSYNPYPRRFEYIASDFPKEFDENSEVIREINKKYNVNSCVKEVCRVDLDGNGKDEFLILVVDYVNNFFTKCLVDSNYHIVSYLTVFNEKYEYFDELVKDCDVFSSGEIIDINNDGIMEIIVDLPCYEGLLFKIFTYNNGNFVGDYITNTSLKP